MFKDSFNYLFEIPHNKGISTADFWNKGVDWIFDTFFVYIKAFNTWLITRCSSANESLVFKNACSSYFSISGWSRIFNWWNSFSISCCALTLFIALSPWWDRALVTTYMATFGVIVSCTIGFTVGTLCFQNKNSSKIYARQFVIFFKHSHHLYI